MPRGIDVRAAVRATGAPPTAGSGSPASRAVSVEPPEYVAPAANSVSARWFPRARYGRSRPAADR